MNISECGNCGRSIAEGANFCPECGESVSNNQCPECGEGIDYDASYCINCGFKLGRLSENSGQKTDYVDNTDFEVDANPPPSWSSGIVSYFVPFASNEKMMLHNLGGCPACGEGINLRLKSKNRLMSGFSPSGYDIDCERCGTKMRKNGICHEIVEGPEELEGMIYAFDPDLPKARRENDADGVEKIIAEQKNKLQKSSSYDPKLPILSIFSSLMIIRTGFYSLEIGNPVYEFPILVLLGTLIIPRVRGTLLSNYKLESTISVVFRILVGAIYIVLTLAAILIIVGEGATNPQNPVWTGALSVILILILATFIVLIVRILR
jgi:RNA polymerase subunit RPABC4/transcription elongation factor Spt4